MRDTEQRKTGGSSTLNRALEVLEALASGPHEGMTAAQLADVTASNRVSIHRILGSYLAHGLVRQEHQGAPYRLGFRLLELAQRVIEERELVALAHPLMEELTARGGETCHLAAPDAGEVVYVAKIESTQSVRLVSQIGARVPLYCTSLGKALLAATEPARCERLIGMQSFEPRTPRTHTSAEELLADLETVRARGYSIDDVENEEGVRCVGAPVLDHAGYPVAAISVSGPTSRVTEDNVDALGVLASETAARLSEAIGYDSGGAQPWWTRVAMVAQK
jgi:DNA-binding IclR family transcriptional regulator